MTKCICKFDIPGLCVSVCSPTQIIQCVCVCVCVRTLRAALAEFLAEVLGGDTWAGGVTWLPGVVTWLVVVHVIGGAI